jgi:hypothetical protein
MARQPGEAGFIDKKYLDNLARANNELQNAYNALIKQVLILRDAMN